MEINEAFVSYLGELNIGAYPDFLPEDTEEGVVYHAMGGSIDYTLTGLSGHREPIYQFDCWANSDMEAKDLYNRLAAAFNYVGNMGGIYVQFIEQISEPLKDFEEETGNHCYKVDFKFCYEK